MNKLTITLLMVFIFCTANQSFSDGISSPSKNIFRANNQILLEGRWSETTQGGTRIIPKINTTTINCNKNNMICVETIAKLTTPKDSKLFENKLLFIQEFRYKILSWNDNTIVAKREAPVADVLISISIDDNHADKSFRETKARGNSSADSDNSYRWVLE